MVPLLFSSSMRVFLEQYAKPACSYFTAKKPGKIIKFLCLIYKTWTENFHLKRTVFFYILPFLVKLEGIKSSQKEYFLYVPPHLENIERKISSQKELSFTRCLPTAFTLETILGKRYPRSEKAFEIVKSSTGLVECGFDNPADKIHPRFEKKIARILKMI